MEEWKCSKYDKCYKVEKQAVSTIASYLLNTWKSELVYLICTPPPLPPATEDGLTATMFFNEYPNFAWAFSLI